MPLFRKTRKYGTIALAAWLIAVGATSLVGRVIPLSGLLLDLLAIAAGILILMDK